MTFARMCVGSSRGSTKGTVNDLSYCVMVVKWSFNGASVRACVI